jgi:hypothetical protein
MSPCRNGEVSTSTSSPAMVSNCYAFAVQDYGVLYSNFNEGAWLKKWSPTQGNTAFPILQPSMFHRPPHTRGFCKWHMETVENYEFKCELYRGIFLTEVEELWPEVAHYTTLTRAFKHASPKWILCELLRLILTEAEVFRLLTRVLVYWYVFWALRQKSCSRARLLSKVSTSTR